ncbi:HD domain-containing protein [Streptomyces cavernicola]|uniref:Metal-dependent phosphohydrolase n=1 Tax=Streptomyces cavernicola TaxID=3043613 RepID=A0ABT6S740_9ACTN|nr:metal-dependent phosphohydrolase [Streptomyces sp. B-S-A6]MDI3403923.1 metal-dependent phosphohydrolase [Streptomyces sp. B-S-A6]
MEPWRVPQRAPRTVDELLELLYSGRGVHSASDHGGTTADLHEHALRTAALLRRSRPSDKELQVAGLLQDIELLLHPGGAAHADLADAAADALHTLLGGRVARLVRLHVHAERYLAAVEPNRPLSPSSARRVAQRGGAMSAPEADAFVRDPLAEDAVALRQAAEAAQVVELDAGVLEDWRPVLELIAAGHALPPPGVLHPAHPGAPSRRAVPPSHHPVHH